MIKNTNDDHEIDKDTVVTYSKAFSPEILITPTPPIPRGVATAAIVSNSSKIFIN